MFLCGSYIAGLVIPSPSTDRLVIFILGPIGDFSRREITSVFAFGPVRDSLEKAGLAWDQAEITMIPQTAVKLEGREAEKMLNLMEALEDCDDVQHVYANFDIAEDEMERLAG